LFLRLRDLFLKPAASTGRKKQIHNQKLRLERRGEPKSPKPKPKIKIFAVFWWRLGLFIGFLCLHILSRRPPPALDRRNRNTIRKVDSRDKEIQKRRSMNVLVFEFWVGGVWFGSFFSPSS